MRRFWILFSTEFKSWRRDPISAMGGFIPTAVLLIAFSLLFGGRLTFKIAVLNNDEGTLGAVLVETFNQVISPFGTPYYDIEPLSADEAWAAYHAYRIDGVWVIPADFSQRLQTGQNPSLEMHFNNYNDDRAKNHRIYAAEILWRFYEKAGVPGPPLTLAETYPRSEMIAWFPIIAVGAILLSVTLGGMINIFMLTQKEQVSKVTLEFGLAPRSLVWVLLPKTLLALIMGLVTGTVFLAILSLWLDVWPGSSLWAVWLLAGLVTLFWIPITLLLGLHARQYMPGAIASILGALTVFFIGGGLNIIRGYEDRVLLISWLFPNTYAVDPLRDLILFHTWPADWLPTLIKLGVFAAVSLSAGFYISARQLRHLG